ncbi:unnamed protein product [Amoebophrya sp. A120]|nr:unnamed protein product [Amoebophrya sp. A120]|eukprot:GSA120T00006473001.1
MASCLLQWMMSSPLSSLVGSTSDWSTNQELSVAGRDHDCTLEVGGGQLSTAHNLHVRQTSSRSRAPTSFSVAHLLGRTDHGAACRCAPGSVVTADEAGGTSAQTEGSFFAKMSDEASDLADQKFQLWRDTVRQYDQAYIKLQRTIAKFQAARDLVQLSRKNSEQVHAQFCQPAVAKFGKKGFSCVENHDTVRKLFDEAIDDSEKEPRCQFGAVEPLRNPISKNEFL